ncbi:MAG: glycyl-radical enzyme activating protein [Spirochaetaceae bacterium]|nr:MAG: glycyl-radical enzyme activating protein [Spirochaetaceae bacterium]
MSDRHDRSVTGIVTDVQHFSIHDGPGIRTTVFLKGCNLRCFWCHNPETLKMKSELQYFPDRCIACGACVPPCPTGAHAIVDGRHEFDRALCTACGACAPTCFARALVMAGETRTAGEIVDEVARDRAFYETSGGGVTLSGGEPLLQPDFTEAVLAGCLELGISTAIETAANVAWHVIERALPVTKLVMMDIKSADSEAHRSATGVPNERVLANARRIAEYGVPMIVRTPIVPGVNDDEASIAGIAAFLAELPTAVTYELLRFHMMAEAKYAALGLVCRAAGLEPPTHETMQRLTRVARDAGVTVHSA